MANTVVIFHSKYGHTKVVAKYVADGAQAQLIEIDADGNIQDGEWQALNDADAIIFGSPTYMGNVSWQFKKFSDDSSKIWSSGGWNDKIFGGFTNSASPSGDKQVSLIAMQTLASQHGGIWVSLGMPPSNSKAATGNDINNLGGSVGLLTRSPADASIDELYKGDLDTAKLYGMRIRTIAKKLLGD